MSVRISAHQCPRCNYECDSVSQMDDRRVPIENDISICVKCKSINQFNKDLSLRLADKEVRKEVEERFPYLRQFHQ